MALQISGFLIERQIALYAQCALYSGRDLARDRGVLIKTLWDPLPKVDDVKRLEREYWLLRDFGDTSSILQVSEMVSSDAGHPAMICKAAGIPLSHFIEQKRIAAWSLDRIVAVALQAARALVAIHGKNTIHKNVGPANILVDDSDWAVCLMNFDIASTLSREHQTKQMSRRMSGTLAYISPEQTGRVVHDVDSRSDIYSLGVVLFELLFGRKPFFAKSRREWAHAHISQRPQIPDDGSARVPATLTSIVLRMLEKSPEDRYQTALGLACDLERALHDLKRRGRVGEFELGEKDIPEIFRIPQALYGRAAELSRLEQIFEDVVQNDTRVCLISGHSGVGKTALVDALEKSVLRARGYLLRGKFDQFEQPSSYAGITEAFTGLIQDLLAEPPKRLPVWKARISQALGSNAQALIDVLPDLELIIGPQVKLPNLPPTEAQNRLQLCFLNLVRVFAEAGRPLILYFDDLQWSDVPTLNLLQSLATARDIPNLFILSTYRSNEVDGNHRVMLLRNEIAKHREVDEIFLTPLGDKDVHHIVSDALHERSKTSAELARLVHQQTEGNPFFVREMLRSFADQDLIAFEPMSGRWVCDMARIRKAEFGETVIDLLVGMFTKLPDETVDAVMLAACIGHRFDFDILALLSNRSKAELGQALMPALERNLILPLDEGYQLFDMAGTLAGSSQDSGLNPSFRFQHDRLHQAAYELVDPDDRPPLHLAVGRTLLKDIGGPPAPDQLMAIVHHLTNGSEQIESQEEREGLARLTFMAARLAHESSAYPAALDYLRKARALLPDQMWQTHYNLAKELSKLLAQTAYLNGLHEEADAELSDALLRMHTPLEKAQVLAMRTRHYSTLGRMDSSIEAALEGLDLLGISIGRDVSEAQLQTEIAAVAENLGDRRIADLIHSARVKDETILVSIELLMEIFPAAFLSGAGNLFYVAVLKSVNLSLRHGNSTETAFAFAAYGMLLCGGLRDPATGYEYGKLALTMNESYDDIGLKSRIIYVYGMFIHHWSNHWTTLTDWFKRGLEAGYQSGDLLYLAYNAQDCIIWDPTLDIERAIKQQSNYLEIVRDCQYQDSLDSGTLFLQQLKNFAGQTDGQFSLSDAGFDESACLSNMTQRNFMTGVANYNIYKAELHCLYGDFDGARPFIDAQEPLIDSVMSLPQSVRFRLAAFLTYVQQLPYAPESERAELRQKLSGHLDQMTLWAEHNPDNFKHLALLMRAQLALVDGDTAIALGDFERSVQAAKASGYTRDQAMAHEYAATAFAQLELPVAAEAHLSMARQLYAQWGAHRKVAALDVRGSRQKAEASVPERDLWIDGVSQDAMDLDAIMAAARAISGERSQNDLLSRTMQIMIQTTGARRGVYLTPDEDGFCIEAEGADQTGAQTISKGRALASPQDVPLSILNYVFQAKRAVRLENAADERRFDRDPYLRERGTKSVLCLPVQRADMLAGIVYLENDLTTGAFPEERLAIAEMLAAQTAISMENAKLYQDLESRIEERTQELSAKSQALSAVANKLSKYLSPQVYRSLFDQEQEVRLKSERKTLSIFFSDLVGFTEIAEQMDSTMLKTILNQYLSEMSDIALAHGATIDKYVGDAILIFFGDPETRGEQRDALACVEMALAMRVRLEELQADWRARDLGFTLQCRMGIHTGPCVVGNFGSHNRMDYTVIGRAVNLASRLEAAAAPGGLLISQQTYDLVKGDIACVERGQIQLRGILDAVATYEVTGQGAPPPK